MKNFDKVFNSEKSKGFEKYQLATGYISSSTVFFECEKIVAEIEAKGTVEFSDTEGNVLKEVTLPAQTGGREVYDEVECSVRDGSIMLAFSIVEWIDNYPHCDGEHDRWDSRVIGKHTLIYNYLTNEAQIN